MITLFRSNQVYHAKDLKSHLLNFIQKLPQMISTIGTPHKIFRYEFAIDRIDVLGWLDAQKATVKTYWSNRDGGYEMGGVGVADSIKGDEPISHRALFEYMEERLSLDNLHLRYYGGEGFYTQGVSEEWKKFGTYRFIVPQFELFYEHNRTHFVFNLSLNDLTADKLSLLQQQVNDLHFDRPADPYVLPAVKSRMDYPNQKEWDKIFQKVEEGIRQGQFEKIVLARKTQLTFADSISPVVFLRQLKEKTPQCFHFCFQIDEHTAFLGASPERLYKRTANELESEAIAGTRPRGKNDTESQRLKNELKASSKDKKEHQYVVEAILSSLKPLCKECNYDRSPTILELKGGHHLVTRFKGILSENTLDHELLSAIHPTPAVAGTPAKITLEKIRQWEPFDRGWYAGAVGYVGFNEVEFAVAIRSGLILGNSLSLFAGAGIVKESKSQEEWQEIEHKMEQWNNLSAQQ